MPFIKLKTLINADAPTCFDTSRSIDAHTESMADSQEQAVAGRLNGLIGLNEYVTWRAKHFGLWWHLTSRITQMDAPNSFIDEMLCEKSHIIVSLALWNCECYLHGRFGDLFGKLASGYTGAAH